MDFLGYACLCVAIYNLAPRNCQRLSGLFIYQHNTDDDDDDKNKTVTFLNMLSLHSCYQIWYLPVLSFTSSQRPAILRYYFPKLATEYPNNVNITKFLNTLFCLLERYHITNTKVILSRHEKTKSDVNKQNSKQNQPPGNLPISSFYPEGFVIHK